MIIFGYHSGTQNTQNFKYVRHLKWGRLGRGHFELYGITDESKILRSKKIKVVTPHEKCRFWFKDDNTKLLPSQFGYVLFKKDVFKAF